jgi:hypothetical protein
VTLAEVLQRIKTLPRVGDSAIVLDKHGVAHVLVVTEVKNRGARANALSAVLAGEVTFMCGCEAMTYESKQIEHLEIAPIITCVVCRAL